MPIPILNKEDMVYKKDMVGKEDDNANVKIRKEESGIEEEGNKKTKTSSEENVYDIRGKIIDFIKGKGYDHKEGRREFDDETNDLFAKGCTLVELTITVGIDSEIIKQFMEEEN
jgi:hypothetical protein